MEPPMSPDEATALQRKYITKRRRWARAIGRPYAGHEAELPEPAVIDGADDEEG